MTQAMDIYYNSDTFDRLSNPATGLYYQSAGYVYDFLKKRDNYRADSLSYVSPIKAPSSLSQEEGAFDRLYSRLY